MPKQSKKDLKKEEPIKGGVVMTKELHIYLRNLEDNNESWNYIQQMSFLDKELYVKGKNKFKEYGILKKIPKKDLGEIDAIVYGAFPLDSLNGKIVDRLVKFKSLTFVSLVKPKAAELKILKKFKNFKEYKKIEKPTYNVDYMGPITNSTKNGVLVIGMNDDVVEDFITAIKGIAAINTEKEVEIFFANTNVSDEKKARLDSIIRALNIKTFEYDLLDKNYYTDVFTSSWLTVDLRHICNYYYSSIQYKSVYYPDLSGISPENIAKMLKYNYFRLEAIKKQDEKGKFIYDFKA